MWRYLSYFLLAVTLVACGGEQEPIKVGFIGTLTGRTAEVSQAARDGAILAVEEANQAGGINGRKVDLIIYDDRHEHDKVTEGVNTLADSGAVAIIGPMTSQMSVTAVETANHRKIPLISPTTSTIELSGKKDYFFRTISACDINARNLATYARKELKVQRLAILQDLSNLAFTRPWQHCFKEQFLELGGEVVSEVNYMSLEQDFSFHELAEKTILSEPDSVLILANSIDSAIFSQQLSKQKEKIKLFGSDWAFAGDLIRYGGKTVEGFTFTTNLNLEGSSPAFTNFQERFIKRFGLEPKFPSTLAYEATSLLIKALRQNPNLKKLNSTLETIGSIEGLQDKISLNQYGDVIRPTYINKVKNGDFVFVKEEH